MNKINTDPETRLNAGRQDERDLQDSEKQARSWITPAALSLCLGVSMVKPHHGGTEAQRGDWKTGGGHPIHTSRSWGGRQAFRKIVSCFGGETQIDEFFGELTRRHEGTKTRPGKKGGDANFAN